MWKIAQATGNAICREWGSGVINVSIMRGAISQKEIMRAGLK